MTKQRIIPGAILEINIEDIYYYAQILQSKGCAFFDIRSEQPLKDYSVLLDVPVLFIIAVYNDIITQGKWLKVGKLEIREDLLLEPNQFIQDSLSPDNFELYNPNTGRITKTSLDKIIGLERASVWEAHAVEDRLRDHYNNVPCKWLKEDFELFGGINN